MDLVTLGDLGINSANIIPVIAIGGGLFVGVVGIIASTIGTTHKAKAREETRREMAAYVAEGSISPDDAERLLKAGERN